MFGERLKSKRVEKGLTQVELAKRANITRDLYNKYERAGIRPSYEVLVLLSEILNTSIDYLLTGKETPSDGQVFSILNDTADALKMALYNTLGREPTEKELTKFHEFAELFIKGLDEKR